MISCTQTSYKPDFADYLKNERSLKLRIHGSADLDDSLRALQKTYGIDPEKEYDRMKANPEAWIDLINALKANDE